MSKYVPDISSRRWVIIADSRENRPDEVNDQNDIDETCPFCEGNEKMTPHEVYRVGKGVADEPGWEVRVIPNKYPITDFHEVIIHSPKEDDLHHLPKDHIVKVFQTFRQRFNEYKDKGQVIIFCNQGEHAGTSIEHPHSQLVLLPNQINLSTLEQEPLDNIVEENTFFNMYCPDFSQWPYEVWIAPKVEETFFGDITDVEIVDLVDIYVKLMSRLEVLHETKSKTGRGFSYNFYIYPKKKWYIRIIPRFVYRAGFELGTGLSVNVTDPMEAAADLRTSDKDEVLQDIHSVKQAEAIIEEKQDEIDLLKNKLEEMGR
ncbi:hypothetical protein COU87_04370 [Candidatus Roizmanbacteria bacterium CG10_big_fil_rev_8_21_14_0_10_39_12]|uniref:Galactose-1-phosphate uridyl transferase N-terminal domain-containing protein n=1 Tax=Candidatus Roizmanbacteria bacterium CG10_big_fil_rev_8_21_14_0_10_39_12 TaxID=1974852 RepID=A0A2M8KNJ7_9BACT|nr:MAG: hypothetical protein COU87_04370 [Candidatus Roizmanbacteria bacterium CG10_big_fil_rev_8_21_14_0_10_39_12]